MKNVPFDQLEQEVKQKELYEVTKEFIDLAQGAGDFQLIVEYCGFNEEQEEVISIGIIGLPVIFETYTLKCKDGEVVLLQDLER